MTMSRTRPSVDHSTKRCVIYCRASLDLTGEGASVGRQEKRCRALADARGWVVIEVIADNSISAYKEDVDRPGWARLMRMVEAGECDVIVAWHLDRMTRSMIALEKLIAITEEHGVGVATATGDIDLTTDVGRMVARILAAVARAEVERKGERQRSANEMRAQAGGRTVGIRPFGYEDDQMAERKDEADAIRKAADDVLAGISLTQIAKEWRAAGFATGQRRSDDETGEKVYTTWSSAGVKWVLNSPRYIGKRAYKGKIVGDALWPAILDENTFYAVAAVLEQRGVDRRPDGLVKGGMKPINLLSGIAVCGVCGEKMRATSVASVFDSDHRRTYRQVYQCRRKCLWMEREAPEKWIAQRMKRRFQQAELVRHLIATDDGSELEALRKEAVELRTRQDFMAEQFALGALTQSQLTTGTGTISRRMREVNDALARLGQDSVLVDLVSAPDVSERWDTMGLVRQRAAIVAAVRRVALHGTKKGLVPFLGYPDSIRIEWIESADEVDSDPK